MSERYSQSPMFDLTGKVAAITGGGSGLGLEMALGLARAGADVAVIGRRPRPIEEAVRRINDLGGRSFGISADLTAGGTVGAVFAQIERELGPVDVLVNNAGLVAGQGGRAIWDLSDDDWRSGISGILDPAFFCSRAVSKQMSDRGRGKIINISSGLGMRGARDNYMYGCAKGAIVQLTRSLAVSLGRYGVTANCVVPGFFPTEGTASSPMALPSAEFIPVGRVGRPDELGHLVTWLASEASNYMTGEVFVIDGGGLAGGYAPTGYAPVTPHV
ncbi:MAG: SDR family oxidoreductase [Dehalococcoidia bacterium]|nr:SDR family oxidoreductase [Dehalococcoidia bacterium]MSQ35136.1 SDR family oxidoreductase [Dehalococcoidia bacterium]